MARYSIMYSNERSGILTFTAEDDDHALELYEALLEGDIYEADLDDVQDTTEDSNQSFYELRNAMGKQLAD
jgi:hypothetical protein